MKNKKSILILTFLASFIFAGSVSPTLSLRFNDIANAEDALPTPITIIGLKMEVGEGVYAGFDSDQTDFRIFLQRSFGTLGMGRDNAGNPQFTIGANYSALNNMMLSMDYIVNSLNDAVEDQLRMSLSISF